MFDRLKYNIARGLLNAAFRQNTVLRAQDIQWNEGKPQWIALSTPLHFEEAARHNPIVKACVNLLSTAASNGIKYLEDTKTGEVVPWTSNRIGVKNAERLLTEFPNPLQSIQEFNQQRVFYLKIFGNSYVYLNAPFVFPDIDNISTIVNLPSQFVEVKQTGKIYDQISIDGIVSQYALNNTSPVKTFSPNEIIHTNEVNISSEFPSIMGISKLEVLQKPITNIQLAFEFMNTLMATRGTGGIITPNLKDANGTASLLPNEKTELQDKFKKDYGFLNGQNPFLISPIPVDYIKTVMNSRELGIYEDFSNNSILVCNEFGVRHELVSTYIQGSTYANQREYVKSLYQDTVIPMVDGDDKYWTFRLGCKKYGFSIKTSWDHIPVMQDNFKDRATAINLKGRTAKDAYNENIITKNQYLEMLELPTVTGGDKLKSELNNNELIDLS